MPKPRLVMIVGGNGAGKSTYFDLYIKPKGLPFINADLIAKDLFADQAQQYSRKAAKVAEDARYQLLIDKESFCFETVFSHSSKIDFLAQAKAVGYHITMIAIYLVDPQLNCARVGSRVVDGGHSVPEEKILSRIPRTTNNIADAITLCNEFLLFDNSSQQEPFRLKLAIRDGVVVFENNPPPEYLRLLSH
jgi:predicted ABC-type ATPase